MPKAKTFPKLDPMQHGLVPLEHEIWHGFVFVRFKPGPQPSVAELLAEHEAGGRVTIGLTSSSLMRRKTREAMEVNWKAVRDVDNEGYHVPIAHPALHDLYGQQYRDLRPGRRLALGGRIQRGQSRYWSVRNYVKTLPQMAHPPEEARRWAYLGVFPNLVLMLYPDLIGFYQEFPVAVGKTIQRMAYYALPDDGRGSRRRYLAHRIDRITGAEDTQLIKWSWESMQSSGYSGMIPSDLEAGVRDYHDTLRQMLPVMALDVSRRRGQVVALNASLRRAMPDPWRPTH